MKFNRLVASTLFGAIITVCSVNAQQSAARPAAGAGAGQTARPAAAGAGAATTTQAPTPGSTTAAPTSAPGGGGRIAIINSAAFSDPKAGIGRFITAANTLSREFQPRSTEIQNLEKKMNDHVAGMAKTQGVEDPKVTAAKQEQAEQMKIELDRKRQDAQLLLEKRRAELLGPVSEDVGKNLEAFARANGISVIIDASALPQGSLFQFNDSLDITRAFIADYNSKNPATAAAAAATPRE